MLFLLNTLVQICGVVAGIVLIFKKSYFEGLGLIAIVLLLHALFSAMCNGVMFLHQKTIREDQLRRMTALAQLGCVKEAMPKAWKFITWIFAVSYFVVANLIICWFVFN